MSNPAKLSRQNMLITYLKYRKYIRLHRKSMMISSVKRVSSDITKSVLFDNVATAGVITLNRPKNLNVLNLYTWTKVLEMLRFWEDTKSRVIIKGAGDRAFSAGGDIKWLLSPGEEREKRAFAIAMHNAIYLMSKYRIPYVSLMDGITFGGGLAMANGRYKVATERTVVATPETRIGWLTDAGAPYYLPRLHNHLGFYMALTGTRLKGEDVVASGLATHFVPSDRLKKLEAKLCYCKIEDMEAHLNAYSEPVGELSLAISEDINYCFAADTVEEIHERLLKINNQWSLETICTMAQLCPTMLKVSLRALQQGKNKDLKECLRMEYRILMRCIGSYNAQEGLRALLVDKNKPIWRPATLADVSDSMVDSYFEPLPTGDELKFIEELTEV